jgi:hypothetical protein
MYLGSFGLVDTALQLAAEVLAAAPLLHHQGRFFAVVRVASISVARRRSSFRGSSGTRVAGSRPVGLVSWASSSRLGLRAGAGGVVLRCMGKEGVKG